MRNINVKIILPPAPKGPGMVKSPPLDIASLIAVLKQNSEIFVSLMDFRKNVIQDEFFYQKIGVDLSVFTDFKRCLRHFLKEDREINRTVERILSDEHFDKFQYAVFSVSVLEQFSLPLLLSSLCLAKSIKKSHPQIKIVFFGNCPDAHIEKIIKTFRIIDAFPSGANELYAVDFIRNATADAGVGVYHRSNGVIKYPQTKNRIDLDRLALPDFSLMDLDSYRFNGQLVFPFEMSRGCSQRCFFCYYIHKGTINTKDPERAVDDLLTISRQYGVKSFHMIDANINLDNPWLMQLCDILSRKQERVNWCALVIPNMSYEMLDKLKAAGCVQLRWGVESGSQRMLQKVNKGTTRETIKSTLEYAHRIGINNYITLISNLPGETDHDVRETNAFIEEISPYVDSAQECVFGELGHFPLGVFDPKLFRLKSSKLIPRYKDTLDRLNIGREDIVEFLVRNTKDVLNERNLIKI